MLFFSRPLLTLTFAFLALGAFAQPPATVPLSSRQSLLDGRAYLMLPPGAKNMARGADIMAADPNARLETRLVLDNGKERLVLFTREVFTKGTKSVASTLKKVNEGSGTLTLVLQADDSLTAVLSVLNPTDSTREAIRISNLVVVTPDGTLLRVDAYINPAAFHARKAYQQLVERIFRTVAAGERRNNLQPRTETVPNAIGKKALVFELPADYALTIDRKYDFQVFKLHRFASFDEGTVSEQFIVYAGRHPSPVYNDLGLTPSDATSTKGSFLGKDVEWLSFFVPNKNLNDRELLFAADALEPGLVLHVAMIGGSAARIEAMTRIASSIRVAD